MNKVFDYIYYRTAKAYYKWDKGSGNTATILVSLIQSLVIVDIFLGIQRHLYERNYIYEYAKMEARIGSCIFFVFAIINYIKYKNKYRYFRDYWSTETKTQKFFRGIGVLLASIFPWLFLLHLGKLK